MVKKHFKKCIIPFNKRKEVIVANNNNAKNTNEESVLKVQKQDPQQEVKQEVLLGLKERGLGTLYLESLKASPYGSPKTI